MVTLAALQAEPWWGREIVTSPMVGLGLQLRAAYGTGAVSIGIKGNERHLSGGHRSQEWILNSAYVSPVGSTYTVQSGLTSIQARHLAAIDFTPGVWGTPDNRAKMKVLTRRLIDAMKAGQLDELDECFGTLDGATVTGWNNDRDATITADSSHLDHLHLRFDRRFADDNAVMVKTAAIMLGEDMTMSAEDLAAIATKVWNQDVDPSPTVSTAAYRALNAAQKDAAAALDGVAELKAQVAELAARPPVASAPVDPATLKAVMLDPEVLAANARAVNDDAARRQVE